MKNAFDGITISRLKKRRENLLLGKVVAAIISLAILLSLIPSAVFAQEGTSIDSFIGINDAPAEFSSTTDPYGYGIGMPFNMAAQNELLLLRSYDMNTTQKVHNYSVYNGFNIGKVNDNNISDTRMSLLENSGGYGVGGPFTGQNPNITDDKTYMFTKGVAFDPTGSGRNDYVAFIAYDPDTEGGRVVVYIINANTGKCSVAYHAGWAGWIKSEELEQFEANNFFAITAGRYTPGQTGETFVTYSPLSDGNYTLKEWKVEFWADGNIGLKEIGSSKTYLHETYRGSNKGQAMANENKTELKLGVSLSTGDYNGDKIDDLAVLSYTQIPEKASDLKNSNIPTAMFVPQLTVALGNKSNSVLGKTTGVSTRYVRESSGADDDGYPRLLTMAAPSVASGDVNGDGYDEMVVAGWRANVYEQNSGNNAQYYDFEDGVTVGIYQYLNSLGYLNRISYNYHSYEDKDTSILNRWSNRIKEKLDNKSSGNVLPQFVTECVAMDGSSNPEYIFLNGTFCLYDSAVQKIAYKYTPGYFRSEDNACNEHSVDFGFIGSAAVGVFDDNAVGREQIIVSVGLKQTDQDDYFYMLGTMGGRDYNDVTDTSRNVISYGKLGKYYTTAFDKGGDNADYRSDSSYTVFEKGDNYNEKLNCLVVAVDTGTDGTIARYKGKNYNYSDPNIQAVLQAAPYFGELDYYGGQTSYAITTSYNIANQKSESLSYSVGLSLEVEAPGIKTAVMSGYTTGWSKSFESAYEESYTKTFTAYSNNQVVLQRTPVIMYSYDIQDESGNWRSGAAYPYGNMQIAVPCAPVYTQVSISTYNDFVDSYNNSLKAEDRATKGLNKITQTQLLNNEGNPDAYFKEWTETVDGKQFGADTFAVNSGTDGSMAVDFTKASSETVGIDRTDGYYFSGSVGAGASVLLGSVYATLEAGVEGDVTYGTYETKAIQTASSGEVCSVGGIANREPSLLSQFAFSWTFGAWSLKLDNKASYIPVFGYTVKGVSRAKTAPTGLEIVSVDDTKIKLRWADMGSAFTYNIYLVENGQYTKLNSLPQEDNTYTYTLLPDLRPSYTFAVTSIADGQEGVYSNKLIYYSQSYGLTAYQIAVKNGFVGTEAEWLDSLVGETGKTGKDGVGISEVTINAATGELVIILTDGTNITLGDVTGSDGQDGVSIDSLYINENGELVVQLIGSEEQNLGVVVGADGQNGADGANGREIELRTTETHIQWRYIGENEAAWQNLIGLEALIGANGRNGVDGADGLDGLDGLDGENARNISLTVDNGSIWWKLDGDDFWTPLIALSEITGAKGDQGAKGEDGKDGVNGADGANGENGINGANGENGTDGNDGNNGIGITSAHIDEDGYLILTLSDGSTMNAGLVRDNSISANASVSEADAASQNKEAAQAKTLATTGVALAGTSLLWNISSLIFLLLKKKKGIL